jgi:hypothetical protein
MLHLLVECGKDCTGVKMQYLQKKEIEALDFDQSKKYFLQQDFLQIFYDIKHELKEEHVDVYVGDDFEMVSYIFDTISSTGRLTIFYMEILNDGTIKEMQSKEEISQNEYADVKSLQDLISVPKTKTELHEHIRKYGLQYIQKFLQMKFFEVMRNELAHFYNVAIEDLIPQYDGRPYYDVMEEYTIFSFEYTQSEQIYSISFNLTEELTPCEVNVGRLDK